MRHSNECSTGSSGWRSSELTDLTEPLAGGLAAAGLGVDQTALERLARFTAMLLAASEELSLTTIRDSSEALQRQVIEPLAGWRAIASRVHAGPIVEVGAGGGAPGVPLAIVEPDRAVTLVEPRERRAAYLRSLVQELSLANVTVVEERGETFGAASGGGRKSFACAIGRALARLPVALELLLPLVQVGGVAVVYAGPSAKEAEADATVVAAALGADPPELESVAWSGAPLQLTMVTARKSAPTPDRFPRRIRQMRKHLPTA